MSKTILCLFLLLTMGVVGNSQNLKINSEKPVFYISVEKKESEDFILRLHNNSKWAISCKTTSMYLDPGKVKMITLSNGRKVLPLYSEREVSIHFYLDANPNFGSGKYLTKVPYIGYPDSLATSWIASDSSAMFRVPAKYMIEAYRLYVPINYEWEAIETIAISDGVEHRIYFNSSEILPNNNKSIIIR